MLLSILIIGAYLTFFVVSYYCVLATHSTFWLVFSVFAMLVLGFILWCTVWNRVRSILSRHRFCAKIKRFARKNGYVCSFSHTPKKAFFKAYAGEDLILSTDQKTYYLKFFPYFTRKKIISVLDEYSAAFSKPFALVQPAGGGGYAMPHGKVFTENLFERKKAINLSFGEAKDKGECIVIVSPACHKMTCVRANKCDVIDNGYRFENDITFYFQDAFLAFLER